jgi:ParB family chromosome partitioning protein
MMAKSPEEHHPTEVTLVPTDRIRVLNPRVRNPRTFADMVENIAKIGLKRPITVTCRADTDPPEFDLVCGQGRLEAFIELKQKAIPAIVIDADESDCLVMSLVENCARRQHRPIDLMREIGTLRERGYNDRQIGDKIGVSPDYVGMIAGLLERGEERLVTAVETGLLPLNLAIDISKTDAEGAQRALMDAYTQKKLRG